MTTCTDLSAQANRKALISSSTVRPRKALYRCGRLMVITATGPSISYRMSSNVCDMLLSFHSVVPGQRLFLNDPSFDLR